MSALPPKADMRGATRDVRYEPIADLRDFIRLLHQRAAEAAKALRDLLLWQS